MDFRPAESAAEPMGEIFHYSLDFLHRGEQHFYVWRHCLGNGADKKIALLIELNNICIPEGELDKLVFSFENPDERILSIAFTNCHVNNQQQLKRKLKAYSIRLFSNTAFFEDTPQARQWLAGRVATGEGRLPAR